MKLESFKWTHNFTSVKCILYLIDHDLINMNPVFNACESFCMPISITKYVYIRKLYLFMKKNCLPDAEHPKSDEQYQFDWLEGDEY